MIDFVNLRNFWHARCKMGRGNQFLRVGPPMKTSSWLGMIPLALLSGPANAGLIGDTVTTRYVGADDTGAVTSVVGAGEEGSFFNNQFYDYSDFGFSIRSIVSFPNIFATSGPVALQLGSLDFGAPLTAVVLATNLTGVNTNFTATSASFSWSEQAIPAGPYLTARFVTGPTSVPEPGTLALLALGIAGLGIARRKRRDA